MLELLPSSTAALQTAARTARSRSRTPLRNPGGGRGIGRATRVSEVCVVLNERINVVEDFFFL